MQFNFSPIHLQVATTLPQYIRMTRQRRSRCEVLQLLVAAAGTTSLSTLANPGNARPNNTKPATTRPPIARIDGVKETIWGRSIDDPYRWMENPNDADWQPYMERQAAHARAVLDAIPGRDKLAVRVTSLSAEVPRPRKIIPRGGKIFYENRPKSTNNYKLFVRDGIKQPERLLIDPSTLDQGDSRVSIDWWMPSPDGRYVVAGLQKEARRIPCFTSSISTPTLS
jgi:prolyl oligopeptidase